MSFSSKGVGAVPSIGGAVGVALTSLPGAEGLSMDGATAGVNLMVTITGAGMLMVRKAYDAVDRVIR